MSRTILRAEGLGITFGGLRAVDEFSLDLGEGELVGLIGPNGAGKTTVFNLLTGVYRPTAGQFWLREKPMAGLAPHQVAAQGIARTFQNIRLFRELSVLENIEVGANLHLHAGVAASILRLPSYWRDEKAAEEKARELLSIFRMERTAATLAGNLPYGQQRKLEIARALATDPSVLLLDEPAAGMNPTESAELMEVIALIRERFGVAVLLIEHDMNVVMNICERILVMDYGRLIAVGAPHQIANDPQVIAAYLGE